MQSKNAGKRKKKIPFKAQKIRALKRARENPEFSSAFGKKLPQKKFFRSRAHCNPLSHNNAVIYPKSPEYMDWNLVFDNEEVDNKAVSFVDVGCGFGGFADRSGA